MEFCIIDPNPVIVVDDNRLKIRNQINKSAYSFILYFIMFYIATSVLDKTCFEKAISVKLRSNLDTKYSPLIYIYPFEFGHQILTSHVYIYISIYICMYVSYMQKTHCIRAQELCKSHGPPSLISLRFLWTRSNTSASTSTRCMASKLVTVTKTVTRLSPVYRHSLPKTDRSWSINIALVK